MNTAEQQFRNTFIYFLPIVVGSLTPIVALPIFTRILSPHDYGIYSLAQVYAIFVGGLANLGLPAVFERNFFESKNADSQHIGALLFSCTVAVTFTFVLSFVLTYLFQEPISRLVTGDSGNGAIVFWSLVAQYFISINFFYLTYYKNKENAAAYTNFSIAVSLINLMASLILVVWIKMGAIGMVHAQAVSFGLVTLLMTRRMIQNRQLHFFWNLDRETLRMALPLTPRVFLGIINNQFDKYLIGLLSTVGGVGVYGVAQRLSQAVFSSLNALQNVYSPHLYRLMFGGPENGAALGRYLVPFAYLSQGLSLGLAVFSEEVVYLFLGPSFQGAADITSILSLYWGFFFFRKITGYQLIFMKKTLLSSVLMSISMVFNVGLNIPLILNWGAVGAAWGTMLAGLLSGLVSYFLAQRCYAIGWEAKKTLIPLLLVYIASTAVIVLRSVSVAYWVRLSFKFAAIGVYLYLGAHTGVITRDALKTAQKALLLGKMPTPAEN
jgi:O-antigen/teichoic acid export membrane protein